MQSHRPIARLAGSIRSHAMPRYFIDTSDGDFTVIDEDGQDLDSDQTARDAAIQALPEMSRARLPDGDQRVFSVLLRDQDGQVIYSARLTFEGSWQDR
jgi:hypothetical protein